MIKAFFFLLVLVSISVNLMSQTSIGNWQVHFPYSNSKFILKHTDGYYLISDNGVADLNPDDGSFEFFSRVNHLSDIGISAAAINTSYFVLGYSNGNIDVLRNSVFYNISDIKRKDIQGKKAINNIFIAGDSAFLACDFGVVVVNLLRNEISDSYILAENGQNIVVNDVIVTNGNIYAATNQGIYYGSMQNNLLDFSNWNRLETVPFPSGKYKIIRNVFSHLLIVYTNSNTNADSVYYLSGNTWQHPVGLNERVKSVRQNQDNMVVVSAYHIYVFNQSFNKILQFNKPAMNDAYYDGTYLWVADPLTGIVKVQASNFIENTYTPSGPYDLSAFDLKISDNKLYMVPGGRNNAYSNIYYPARVSMYRNNAWKAITKNIVPELSNQYDLINVVIDPANSDHIFAGSWGNGIFEFNVKEDNPLLNIYNEDNSENALQNIGYEPHRYVRIGAMAYDRNKNLWIANAQVANPIVVFKSDGHWKKFACNNLISDIEITNLMVTSAGYIWAVLPRKQEIFVMDIGRNIDNTTDDRYTRIAVKDQNGELINDVSCLAEDLYGTVWVGSSVGVLVYYNQDIPFLSNPAAHRLIIEIDGNAQYLLGTEQITCIAVDGANRKWFGTQKAGAFLISADGSRQLNNFNTSNSPLPSDNIISIAINHQSGEIFFGTDMGLVSFNASAVSAKTDYSKLIVYPNPVRENYQGPLIISGLMYNSLIKITDISGNLVYETHSLGGQTNWNLRNYNGEKVSTGIYLIFCSSQDGTSSIVEKVLIINQK